jgi:hypothetical protein
VTSYANHRGQEKWDLKGELLDGKIFAKAVIVDFAAITKTTGKSKLYL